MTNFEVQICLREVGNTVQLWNLDTRHPISNPLKGLTGAVNSVKFSIDGRWIYCGSDDSTVRRWMTSSTMQNLRNKHTANMSRQQWLDWMSKSPGDHFVNQRLFGGQLLASHVGGAKFPSRENTSEFRAEQLT